MRARLGLEPVVLEPERRRRRDRVDELRLVRERGIVEERADALPVAGDLVEDAGAAVGRPARSTSVMARPSGVSGRGAPSAET